jgi:membrane associated rhomboid family serine protease
MWMTLVAVPALLSIAVWQFYLFVTFKSTTGILDLQGGRGHLWVSISAGLLACIAGFLIFLVFMRYDRERELHIT